MYAVIETIKEVFKQTFFPPEPYIEKPRMMSEGEILYYLSQHPEKFHQGTDTFH